MEESLAAGGPKSIQLQVEVLVVGRNPGIAYEHHGSFVMKPAETGNLLT
jgi:hypothetical protein